MRNETKKAPTIRFRGFTDDWEQRKLSKVVSVCSGMDYKHLSTGNIPVYGTGGYMLSVNKALSYDRDAIGIGRKGTIDKPYILRAPFWTVDTLFYAIPQNEACIDFVYDLFQNVNWKKKDESTGVPSLSKVAINNTNVIIPSEAEQRKIGSFTSQLDILLTLHQRKLDQLKKLKKYFLQNMFPAKGEKVPRIRFKGFTGDWEESKLGDLVLIERGGSPRPIDAYITNDTEGLNWVKISDAPAQGRYITSTAEKIKSEGLSKTRQVFPGDLILSNSMSFGKPYIMAISGCIHDGWLLIRNNQSIFNITFLCYLLGTNQLLDQYKIFAAGSTVNNLNKELVSKAWVSYPNKEEQEYISQFLELIDGKISFYQHKVENLKTLKKYMLQNMFI